MQRSTTGKCTKHVVCSSTSSLSHMRISVSGKQVVKLRGQRVEGSILGHNRYMVKYIGGENAHCMLVYGGWNRQEFSLDVPDMSLNLFGHSVD